MKKPKQPPLYHKAIDELWGRGIEPRLVKLERAIAKLSRDVKSQKQPCIGFRYTPPRGD